MSEPEMLCALCGHEPHSSDTCGKPMYVAGYGETECPCSMSSDAPADQVRAMRGMDSK